MGVVMMGYKDGKINKIRNAPTVLKEINE